MSDFKELEGLVKDLETYEKVNIPELLEYTTKQIGGRFLDRVTKLTNPQENHKFKYKTASGTIATMNIKGGALRRGWTGGKDVDPYAYVNSQTVRRNGNIYELTLSNNVAYSSYVEYGHMQRPGQFVRYIGKEVNGVVQGATLKKAKVPGQHMMRDSANQIKAMAPGLTSKLTNEYFKKHPLS